MMRKWAVFTAGVTAALLSAAGATGQGNETAPQFAAKPTLSPDILHAQVILDRLGFSSGILDGRNGQSFQAALRAFQETRGIGSTGKLDSATLKALAPYNALRPTKTLALTADALAGPFVRSFPKNPVAQSKLPRLGYRASIEKLAEMFHTTPQVLLELNSRETRLAPGVQVVFPNALPGSRDYPASLDAEWRKTLNELNVDARQPQAAKVVVDKSESVLKVYDANDRLVAQFPATMGSKRDPLPIGMWKIQGASYNPEFHYNPELFWDVSDKKPQVLLPPGPNGPVGVVWLDLSKPHYGIHGTPEPQTIGRAESHGCIRLTNWDAARLSLMVKPGTPALFQE